MKKISYLLMLVLAFSLFINITLAEDITSSSKILVNGSENSKIKDDKETTYITISTEDTITIEAESIYGIYIEYEMNSVTGTISNELKSANIGENDFLHEYIDVDSLIGNCSTLSISYDESVKIADIYVLSAGDLPDFVEVWDTPAEKADLLLFSTHSDDEQLFFLGLLPTYVAYGAEVQVVYFTNHYDNSIRLHEQLHGLYTVGVRHYPIIGIVPDAWSTTLDGAISNLKSAGLTIDDAYAFEVEMIRRFKPLVVVGHDEAGEYSHGQHILNTYVLENILDKTNDATYDEESYNLYGGWDVPKVYLHLYEENQIIMDYDTPLEYFDGLTAYEVSKKGYSKHNSQQWTWFTSWINGKNNEYTKATDITTYSPVKFGLYRSLVGEDIEKNDMFENLTMLKDEIKEEEETTTESVVEKIKEETSNFDYKKLIIPGLVLVLLISGIIILKHSKKKRHRRK